ncbi:ATP-dependent DNA helicase [Thiohalomonas denitrificans]|uniref:ATP-dependent DNA helicase DinG n=1 Tax=Thiohalomonas denitrificans TaxID=415747 RepID=A0A1G5Q292_9GAMM|nr:ATP-dependent DNA helicase [Thiohalomonas denitrificans]SCZ55738.1 ATP-dependent DNA helicase DinG [Thiohalomonas denitrificans]
MQTPGDILGPDGPFARLLTGFSPRLQQREMADAVAEAIAGREVLVAEAGTGTGKTFAYLVPALLSGEKVIISTGTRNLQDQLFTKDLPLVRDALALPVEVALLKGRANYLCLPRLDAAVEEGFASRRIAAEIQTVRRWAAITAAGDIAELTALPEDSQVWPMVTSTADNCHGGECDHFNDCFLMKARRAAQEADVLVVNHHLLFADMALKESGFGELLPGASAFILDEAHQLPETASHFFGTSITGNQLLELVRDSITEELREAGDSRSVRESAESLEKSVRDLRLAFGESLRRGPWREVMAQVMPVAKSTAACLGVLNDALEQLSKRGKGLEACARRAVELSARFDQLVSDSPVEGYIHWYETHKRSFGVNLTPMEVDQVFREQLERFPQAWIMTSATLAVGEEFGHFTQRLGIGDAVTRRWESPYDFARQAVLYVPQGIPEPPASDYTAAVVESAIPVMEAAGGRTFMLFTSHRALHEAAELLEGRFDYPILIQGDAPRSKLLERFRELGNAVLLGTGSFWEGVDVRGEALSCVVIDKLPFASPGDPVLQARIDAMREQGGNPFRDHQLPQAVISLKQGVGRLIRDATDYGVLVLCDPRLGSRSYGRVFLDALPPMTRTRKLEVVERFFRIRQQPRTANR